MTMGKKWNLANIKTDVIGPYISKVTISSILQTQHCADPKKIESTVVPAGVWLKLGADGNMLTSAC